MGRGWGGDAASRNMTFLVASQLKVHYSRTIMLKRMENKIGTFSFQLRWHTQLGNIKCARTFQMTSNNLMWLNLFAAKAPIYTAAIFL